jgi:hypothetical protein
VDASGDNSSCWLRTGFVCTGLEEFETAPWLTVVRCGALNVFIASAGEVGVEGSALLVFEAREASARVENIPRKELVSLRSFPLIDPLRVGAAYTIDERITLQRLAHLSGT